MMRGNAKIWIVALLATGLCFSPSLAQNINFDYLEDTQLFTHDGILEIGKCKSSFPSFPRGGTHCPNICIYNIEKLTHEERSLLSDGAERFLADEPELRELIMTSSEVQFLNKTCRKILGNISEREVRKANVIEESYDQCVLKNLDKVNTDKVLNMLQGTCRRIAERAFSKAIDRELTLRRLAESELTKARAQVRELREQLGGLHVLLDDAEERDAASQVQIAKLGERLNRALAKMVGELARFRSVFFEKMEKVLGGRQDIRRVGDRFVFQSEVLFAQGSAELGPVGQAELAKLGAVLREVADEMPADLNWILRIDGHTDNIPVGGRGRYRDNWELSQGRALSVVKFLIERENVPPHRLAATGFGEFQPIDDGDTPEALARNRRIEFKFTQR